MSFVERQRISRYQQTRLHYSCNRNKKAPISTGWVRGQSLTTAVCKRRDVTRAWRETFVLTFLSWQNAAVSEKTNNRGIREMRSSDVSTDDQWPYTETFLKRLCCVESVECHAWSVIRTGASLISTQWAHNSDVIRRLSSQPGPHRREQSRGEALSVPAALCRQGEIVRKYFRVELEK